MAGRGSARALVVCGPTATGKTELAAALCRRFNGELVGADSMQVYKGLPIGTALPSLRQTEGINTHLIGFLSPQTSFSVAQYVALGQKALAAIHARQALPVVCGGTGLYLDSLLRGLRFTPRQAPQAREISEQLEKDWKSLGGQAMLARLAEQDPAHAARLHADDKRRILNSLAAWQQTGRTRAQRDAASQAEPSRMRCLWLGLDEPDRSALYARTDARVEEMMKAGLLEEARHVYEKRAEYRTAAQAIGYKEFFGYFAGEESLPEAVARLKQATRRYAKRQLTWFRRNQDVHWLNASAPDLFSKAFALAQAFLEVEI